MTQPYVADRERVWLKLSDLLRDAESWTHVRGAQRTRDGRLAFISLKSHYLGRNNVDLQSAAAERILQQTTCAGEKRRWNFEKCSRLHKTQHIILEGLQEFGCSGIDARSKVRHLLGGVKTFELDSAKTQIMASTDLRSDFDGCASLYKDYISTRASNSNAGEREARIAKVETTKFEDVKPDMSVQDRCYKKEEHKNLSRAAKKGLQIKRKARADQKRNNKRQKLEIENRTVKALGAEIASNLKVTSNGDKETKPDDSDGTDSEERIPRKKSNRGNKALQRKST